MSGSGREQGEHAAYLATYEQSEQTKVGGWQSKGRRVLSERDGLHGLSLASSETDIVGGRPYHPDPLCKSQNPSLRAREVE